MYETIELKRCRNHPNGTEVYAVIPDRHIAEILVRKGVRYAELRFDDGRHISAEQRKKAYATIRDIAEYTGYMPEEAKEHMKFQHMIRTGDPYFSLSDCSMDTAREFINTLIDIALSNGIPLSEHGIDRTDDIERYLYMCLLHKKCAVCGRNGEIHHEDTIGMGNNRYKVDDSSYRKICLCREHHTAAHQMGAKSFREMYKVYGIVMNEMG